MMHFKNDQLIRKEYHINSNARQGFFLLKFGAYVYEVVLN